MSNSYLFSLVVLFFSLGIIEVFPIDQQCKHGNGNCTECFGKGVYDYSTYYTHKKYSPLFSGKASTSPILNLESLKKILVERQNALLHANRDGEQRVVGPAALKARIEEYTEKQIEMKCSPSTLVAYREYMETLRERRLIDGINQILVYYGEAMSPEDVNRLCVILYENRVDVGTKKPSRDDWSDYVDRKTKASERIQEQAGIFMSNRQLFELDAYTRLEIGFVIKTYLNSRSE